MTTHTTNETETTPEVDASVTTPIARPKRRPRAFARSRKEGLDLRFELPGTTRGSIELSVEDGELHLVAKTGLANPEGPFTGTRLEFQATDFEGRWALPDEIDVDRAETELEHGVLVVRFPLLARERKTIEIA